MVKSQRQQRKRHLNRLLPAAAAGPMTPDLLQELKEAYIGAGQGERTKISRRLSLAGVSWHTIEEIKGVTE